MIANKSQKLTSPKEFYFGTEFKIKTSCNFKNNPLF